MQCVVVEMRTLAFTLSILGENLLLSSCRFFKLVELFGALSGVFGTVSLVPVDVDSSQLTKELTDPESSSNGSGTSVVGTYRLALLRTYGAFSRLCLPPH